MDFQNVNPLNVRLNLISGNLLPMTSDNTLFPVAWKIYSIVLWLVLLLQTGATIPAFMLVPKDKSLRNPGTINIVVCFEVFVLLARMYTHRDLVRQLIQKLNDILRSADETMKSIVQSTLKPLETPLEIYSIFGIASVMLWCAMPLALLLKRKYFFYDDFGLLIAFSKQPFSGKIFLLGNFIVTIACTYVFTKKVALDVYMINLTLLMTAQYRYTGIKLATIFRKDTPQNQHNKSQKEYYSNLDTLAAREINALCRHHSAVIQ
nr:PREDICTED: uncharacterized protein LOC105678925 [Linepithema humile]